MLIAVSDQFLSSPYIFICRCGGIGVERLPCIGGSRFKTDPCRKRGSDRSNAKRLATGVSVTGPRR